MCAHNSSFLEKQQLKEIIKSPKSTWHSCPWWVYVNAWPQLQLAFWCDHFVLGLGCRAGHLLPLIEILARSWAWKLSSGFQRNWLKTTDKVGLLQVVDGIDRALRNPESNIRCIDWIFFHQGECLPTHQKRHVSSASTGRLSHSPLLLNWRK